jgi:hypothetical protein
LGHPQVTEHILDESGLQQIDRKVLYGDVLYLENKGLIKGEFMLGSAHPPWISITSFGIDFVESIVDESIQNNIMKKHITNEVDQILREIDPAKKVKKVVEYAQKTGDQWMNIVKIAKSRFYN